MEITSLERTGFDSKSHQCAEHTDALRDILAAVRRWDIGDIASLTVLATHLPSGFTWFDARIITTDQCKYYTRYSYDTGCSGLTQ